jgi:hypothetical protein
MTALAISRMASAKNSAEGAAYIGLGRTGVPGVRYCTTSQRSAFLFVIPEGNLRFVQTAKNRKGTASAVP